MAERRTCAICGKRRMCAMMNVNGSRRPVCWQSCMKQMTESTEGEVK